MQKTKEPAPKGGAGTGATDPANEVRLVGRLSAAAESRALPSGDEMATFRVVVERSAGSCASRATVDVIDCVVWGAGQRRRVLGWSAGDVVEVSGALRRRFYRTAGGATGSRTEVEVLSGRRRRRADSG